MKNAEFLATDAEVENIENLAKGRLVAHWPALIRIINRLRNAEQLAAAVPDLLAALKSAEGAVEELCIEQHPDNQCWVVLKEVRAAIAKVPT
ncbi:MAG: hypothetical protein EOS02_09825 [Mesorhizobium sp.]|nr:MAG: hypothetical protein EOS02_09825 [Mesorhizobium sp.]